MEPETTSAAIGGVPLAIIALNVICAGIVFAGWKWFPARISNTIAEVIGGLTMVPVVLSSLTAYGMDWRELVPPAWIPGLVVSFAVWIWVARKIKDPEKERAIEVGREVITARQVLADAYPEHEVEHYAATRLPPGVQP